MLRYYITDRNAIGGENHDIRLGMAYAVWRCATVEFGDVKAVAFEFVNEQLIRRFVRGRFLS